MNFLPFHETIKKPARTIMTVYAVSKVLFFLVLYPDYALSRAVASAVLLAVIFLLTGSRKLTNRMLSVLVPVSTIIIELVYVSLYDGDRIIYYILGGCSLLSLMYADVIGLTITIIFSCTLTAFLAFVLGIPLLGAGYSMLDEVLNYSCLVILYLLIFIISKNTINTLERFWRTGQIFTTALETAQNLIIVTDDNARVEYISKTFLETLGIEKREYAVNLPLAELFPSEQLKLYFGELLKRDGSISETFEVEIYGKQRHFMLRSVTLSESGCARMFDCVEITPLLEARLAAEEANRSKSNFLARISHEIRTPMNAIIGLAQIQMQKALPEEYAEAIKIIYNSGNSLLGIINDVLDMSKLESGKLELNPVEYDVPSLINDTVQINILRIGSKPIEFKLNIQKDLPSRLYGDELRLKQILNNLISNAIKYTKEGYVKLTVSHERQNDSIILKIEVEDSGQGMKSDDLEKLFSQYARFNMEANRIIEGTGLGLNITKELVEMMEGTIDVKSEHGKGSAFTVKIKQGIIDCEPIGECLAEQLNNFTYEQKISHSLIAYTPMPYGRVLVVDDSETNLFVARGLLIPYELMIETADSGFMAIKKIESGRHYDIIFMDHMMPEMDGIETTRKIRETGYVGAIVALTANALVGNDKMFKANGFDEFISKPIDIRQLNRVLTQFVREKHPEESGKYKEKSVVHSESKTGGDDSKLLKVLRNDAIKAVAVLRETKDSDLKLFTTAAHAMKSALANIGENETSAMAFALEKAGLGGDAKYIAANVEVFVDKLEALIGRLTPPEPLAHADTYVSEDTAYFTEQLSIIKEACENYDSKTAYAALDRLKEKPWKAETAAALEHIRDLMFLHSDFEEAGNRVLTLLSREEK